jgi:DNA-binding NarL/FixJ family response regulator
VAGLLLGADDFIVKPFEPSELVARARRFVIRKRLPAYDALPDPDVPRLTPREGEVLELLAEGRRQKEIAHALSISPKTVGTHVQNLGRDPQDVPEQRREPERASSARALE